MVPPSGGRETLTQNTASTPGSALIARTLARHARTLVSLVIIDLKALVRSGRAKLAPDRIHATTAGYEARAQLIHQALPLAAAAGAVGSATAAEVLANRRIILTAGRRADLARPGIDPRLLATLKWIGDRHTIMSTALRADHDPGTNREAGRAIDIGAVDGEICRGCARAPSRRPRGA